MAKCKLSGKGPMHGNSVPWSKKKTKRQWQPNVQNYTSSCRNWIVQSRSKRPTAP